MKMSDSQVSAPSFEVPLIQSVLRGYADDIERGREIDNGLPGFLRRTADWAETQSDLTKASCELVGEFLPAYIKEMMCGIRNELAAASLLHERIFSSDLKRWLKEREHVHWCSYHEGHWVCAAVRCRFPGSVVCQGCIPTEAGEGQLASSRVGRLGAELRRRAASIKERGDNGTAAIIDVAAQHLECASRELAEKEAEINGLRKQVLT